MTTEQMTNERDDRPLFKFNKPEAIAGYAFVGAWLGLIFGFTGIVGPDHSSQVSLGLAALGAIVGTLLVSHG